MSDLIKDGEDFLENQGGDGNQQQGGQQQGGDASGIDQDVNSALGKEGVPDAADGAVDGAVDDLEKKF